MLSEVSGVLSIYTAEWEGAHDLAAEERALLDELELAIASFEVEDVPASSMVGSAWPE